MNSQKKAPKYVAKHQNRQTPAPKIVSIILAALIGGSCISLAALAYADDQKNKENAPAADNKTVVSETAQTQTQTQNSKTETVYVIANADGTVKKILVSDWIQNALGSDSVQDQSELDEVTAVKGDTAYTMNGDDLRVWDAQGGDVYTQGTIEKELPVNLAVSYQLDGKAISAEELAGKSGKVTIRFDYDNNQYETKIINGKTEKIYVPFVMLTGTILDNTHFTNVQISNGKMINDGDRSLVVGFALPGLQEDLGVDSDTLELPDYVEITADVTDFELTTTMTFATNDLFNLVDVDGIQELDDLKVAMNSLGDAMNQLMDGSSQLYDGLSVLLDKSGTLISGINQLTDGAKQLVDGANQVENGAELLKSYTAQLRAGTTQLQAGADEANSGANALNDGVGEFAEKLADGLSQMDGGVAQLQDGLSQVSSGLTQVTGNNDANSKALIAGMGQVLDEVLNTAAATMTESGLALPMTPTHENYKEFSEWLGGLTTAPYTELSTVVNNAAIEQAITTIVLDAMVGRVHTENNEPMSIEQYQAAKESGILSDSTIQAVDSAIDYNIKTLWSAAALIVSVSPTIQQQIKDALNDTVTTLTASKKQLDSVYSLYDGLVSYTGGVDQVAAGIGQVQSGASDLKSQLEDGAEQLNNGAEQLKDGSAQLKDGLSELAAGTQSAADGTAQLDGGMGELLDGIASVSDGAAQLFDGMLTLKDGSGALVDGVTQLKDGAMQLSDGLTKFNEEGISKLTTLVTKDLDSFLTRLKATSEVSKNYRSFAGISDDMDGKVSFIYKTDAIEAPKAEQK